MRHLVSRGGGAGLHQCAQSHGVDIAEFRLVRVQHLIGERHGDFQHLFRLHGGEQHAQGLDGHGLHVVTLVVQQLQHSPANVAFGSRVQPIAAIIAGIIIVTVVAIVIVVVIGAIGIVQRMVRIAIVGVSSGRVAFQQFAQVGRGHVALVFVVMLGLFQQRGHGTGQRGCAMAAARRRPHRWFSVSVVLRLVSRLVSLSSSLQSTPPASW